MELKKLRNNLAIMDRAEIVNQDLDNRIDEMLVNIGTTDEDLREGIYEIFHKLIMGDYLTNLQITKIMDNCLDKLFYRIGEANEDSVFTRSFSSLVIASILNKDKELSFLSEEQLREVVDKCDSYFRFEKDFRGYVEEKGWAHSIAHAADLLCAVIHHPSYNLNDTKRLLGSLMPSLFSGVVLVDNEDERLICAFEGLLERGLDDQVVEEWILQVFAELKESWGGTSLIHYKVRTNVKNFMKTLYFRLAFKKMATS
ncbi:DUF2785 domain-containing protein [Bacillus haimaensis]|uniref:DUF2785 domain-containing protein n=1 Tax=Bacillus haimaensis TaxID=3160967 RepID=UPI003AA84302